MVWLAILFAATEVRQSDANAIENEAEPAKTVMRGINKQAVGVPRVELGTSSLSATRSNQLSYAPGLSVFGAVAGR